MNPLESLDHYRILTSMLAPALLMAATGSLLVSANARLARVVDRLRAIINQNDGGDPLTRAEIEDQILRHRRRAHLVLRACLLLYLGLGAMVNGVLDVENKSVYPSAALCATACEPIVPPAPGRFSTTTFCPNFSPSFCESARARMSVAPPAGKGTIMRTGLLGKA